MKNRKYLFTFILLIIQLSASELQGQYLINIQSLGVVSSTEVSEELGFPVEVGVRTYKLNYEAFDWNGELDTLSGLLTIPDYEAVAFPIVTYQHGTSNSPQAVPSNRSSGYEECLAYSASGYATMAPDYFGLGDSDGFHPYVHAESEALAGVYMILAGKEAMDQLSVGYTDQLFLSGYSQGGHAAMALHKMLQEEWSTELPVTASAPMSGPYSISVVMRDLILSDETYFFVGYVPYVILSYEFVYGNIYDDYEDVFKPQYVPDIEAFFNNEQSLSDMTFNIGFRILGETGNLVPKFMLQDTMLHNFADNPNHPLRQALLRNDTYNWAPQSPMRLYFCEGDDQVPFMNSIAAADSMTRLGAMDVSAVSISKELDHVDCAPPAILESIDFFNSFLPVTTTLDPGIVQEFSVYPNPASDYLTLDLNDRDAIKSLRIYNASGTLVRKWDNSVLRAPVHDLPEGIYYVSVLAAQGIKRSKFIIAM
jgi:hypothetical protein